MKNCKQCTKELIRKVWYGKRRYLETNKRWADRQYCDERCRADALTTLPPEQNYFFGKHLVPWNKGRRTSKGWKVTDERGYIRCYTENGAWEYEHRIVARKHLGEIADDEVVHHVNWNRSDNRPDNLMVVKRASHQQYHQHASSTP